MVCYLMLIRDQLYYSATILRIVKVIKLRARLILQSMNILASPIAVSIVVVATEQSQNCYR